MTTTTSTVMTTVSGFLPINDIHSAVTKNAPGKEKSKQLLNHPHGKFAIHQMFKSLLKAQTPSSNPQILQNILWQ